ELMVMAYSTMHQQKAASEKQSMDEDQQIYMKGMEINKGLAKVHAEHVAATEQFVVACVCAGITIGCAAVAGASEGATAASVNTITTCPAAGSQAVQALGNLLIKNFGAQKDADELEIQKMRYQMLAQIMDAAIKKDEQAVNDSKESTKATLKIIADRAQM